MHIVMFPVDARLGTDFARGPTYSSAKSGSTTSSHALLGPATEACDFTTYLPTGSDTQCLCLDRPGAEATLPC